jgi:YHS domain-containing protein
MKRTVDGEHGRPGEGKGRRDEVGRTGIWPASGPLPSGDAPIVGQGELGNAPHQATAAEMTASADAFQTDPVCGARINVRQGERVEHNGHAYYFDSVACRRRFEEAPERFTTALDRRPDAR